MLEEFTFLELHQIFGFSLKIKSDKYSVPMFFRANLLEFAFGDME